ncbi:hypothetical protein [Sabulicella rubraurantiaca]|uniref:hypothetical protein n=1 Tax=Sabulicella rubraurantiaca TaxID=2811429 RepID=UPI002E29D0C4|nr:hypothetical protein [Sabulicella rubraurantiaca]
MQRSTIGMGDGKPFGYRGHQCPWSWNRMNDPEELERLAADWIALWESEVASAARDREAAEAWSAGMALLAAFWRAQAAGAAALVRWAREHSPHPAPRPAPPAPPPDAGRGAGDGGDGPAALRQRIAELERRLSEIENGTGGSGTDRGPTGGKRRRG